jgi:hypothetical protein
VLVIGEAAPGSLSVTRDLESLLDRALADATTGAGNTSSNEY